jgi:hypothetical protein
MGRIKQRVSKLITASVRDNMDVPHTFPGTDSSSHGSDKKILLIAPPFFGYHRAIIDALTQMGAEVDYIDDRPSASKRFKILSRVNMRLVEPEISKHFKHCESILSQQEYDMVLVVGGMSYCFTRDQTESLRRRAGAATFVLYLWDALANCQRIGDSLNVFDHAVTFDPNDARSHTELSYLPLFFTADCGAVAPPDQNTFVYDACFVGSVHQVSKFLRVDSMLNSLEENGANVFRYYYMPSRLVALERKILHKEYRGSTFSYRSLSRQQLMDVYAKSKTLVDSPQQNQSGLTIRTIEAVGSNRKVVTSNPSIAHHDFYAFGNAAIVKDGEMPEIDFVRRIPAVIPMNIRQRYSIDSWLSQLICDISRGSRGI